MKAELEGVAGERAEPLVIQPRVDRALFEKREPRTTANQIDLTDFYTGELGEPFGPPRHYSPELEDDDLSGLPIGWVELGGIGFDVRGIIQLRRAEPLGGPWECVESEYATRVDGIPLGREAERLHFLLGTMRSETDGKVIGNLVLHYNDGETRSLDLVYGRDVRGWWYDPAKSDAETADRAKVVWTGTNPVANESHNRLRLYLNTRENPRPGVKIMSFDFVSAMSESASFLIALTVE